MANLPRSITSEEERVAAILTLLKEAMARKERTPVELAAICTFLHHMCTGMENLLRQLLASEGIEIPKDQVGSRDLLTRSVAVGVVSKALADELAEYLAFHRAFVLSAAFTTQESAVRDLADEAPAVWSTFRQELESYVKEWLAS
jgi:hypothetical protein